MSVRNTRREQQRRQKEYHARYGIKLTSVALRPNLHVPVTYLKDTHHVTLSDIIQCGLRVYKAMHYFQESPSTVPTNFDQVDTLREEE